MFPPLSNAMSYHADQVRQYQHVLDADGNVFSDQHRAAAREAIQVHNAILKELIAARTAMTVQTADKDLTLMRQLQAQAVSDARVQDLRIEGTEKGSMTRTILTQDLLLNQRKIKTFARALALMLEDAARPVIAHLKRGSKYTVFGEVTIQTERPLVDNDVLRLYRDVGTGAFYARPPEEFTPDRFEAVI